MKTLEYLDAAKEKLHLPSDYALAKKLEVTKETVSQLRAGKMAISEGLAEKIAGILQVSPIEVLVARNADKAKSPEIQAAWESLLEKISKGFEGLIPRFHPRWS
jgi:transcriptional regulator with XRE-family HTH domain